MIVVSVLYAILSGNSSVLTDAVFEGLDSAVSLVITMLGILCFWSGIVKIAEKSGLTDKFAKLISPISRLLFPNLNKNSDALKAISMNMSANMLGLGSAATPLGLKAMSELQKCNPIKHKASDEMVMFVLVNTASIQIIPTTIAALRMKYGSVQPFDILPAIWISSVCSLCVGVILVKVFIKYGK